MAERNVTKDANSDNNERNSAMLTSSLTNADKRGSGFNEPNDALVAIVLQLSLENKVRHTYDEADNI